jgi:hypothetical protein
VRNRCYGNLNLNSLQIPSQLYTLLSATLQAKHNGSCRSQWERRLNLCPLIYIYIYIHTHTPTHKHTKTYTNTLTNTHTNTPTHTPTHTHTHTPTHQHTHQHTLTPTHTHTHTHIYIYIYIYTVLVKIVLTLLDCFSPADRPPLEPSRVAEAGCKCMVAQQ